jgi:hypothetical protein
MRWLSDWIDFGRMVAGMATDLALAPLVWLITVDAPEVLTDDEKEWMSL